MSTRAPSIKTTHLLAATLTAYSLTPHTAHAAVDTWQSAATGLFHVGTNWTDGSAPTPADSVRFNIPGTYTIQFDDTTGNPNILSAATADGKSHSKTPARPTPHGPSH